MLILQRLRHMVKTSLLTVRRLILVWRGVFYTQACILLAALSILTNVSLSEQSDPEGKVNGRKLRPGLEGQATLEWVLIGGVLVVIIVSILTMVFKPQLEAILTSIMNTIQQNTSAAPK